MTPDAPVLADGLDVSVGRATAVVLLLAAVNAGGILLLRGLPETAGVDPVGPRPVPGGAA